MAKLVLARVLESRVEILWAKLRVLLFHDIVAGVSTVVLTNSMNIIMNETVSQRGSLSVSAGKCLMLSGWLECSLVV